MAANFALQNLYCITRARHAARAEVGPSDRATGRRRRTAGPSGVRLARAPWALRRLRGIAVEFGSNACPIS